MYTRCIDQCLTLLNIARVHPGKRYGLSNLFFHVSFLFSSCFAFFLLLTPFKNRAELGHVIDGTMNMIYVIHSLSKLSILGLNKSTLLDILTKMDQQFWNNERVDDTTSRQIFTRDVKRLHLKTKLYVFIVLVASVIYIFERSMVLGRFSRDTSDMAMYIPDSMPFQPLYLYMGLMVAMYTFFIVTTDAVMMTIAELTEMQFKMLNQRVLVLFASNCDEHIRQKMRDCNSHLSFMINFRNLINNMCSKVMLLYVGIVIISNCLGIYILTSQISFLESIRSMLYPVGLFYQFLFIYILPIQRMVEAAQETANNVYLSNWQNYPEHYKDIQILIAKAQQEVYISAGGLTNMDLKTGLATIKTTVSYFTFLQGVTGGS